MQATRHKKILEEVEKLNQAEQLRPGGDRCLDSE